MSLNKQVNIIIIIKDISYSQLQIISAANINGEYVEFGTTNTKAEYSKEGKPLKMARPRFVTSSRTSGISRSSEFPSFWVRGRLRETRPRSTSDVRASFMTSSMLTSREDDWTARRLRASNVDRVDSVGVS